MLEFSKYAVAKQMLYAREIAQGAEAI